MTSFLNHAIITKNTGSNTGANYAFGFTPNVGSLLVVVGAGPVTFSTPTGWTLAASQVSSGAIYVFTKIAATGDTSFTTNHNGTGMAAFPASVEVYEFIAGSTFVKALGVHELNASGTLPQITSLTGTNTIIWSMVAQLGTSLQAPTLALSQGTSLANVYQFGTSDGSIYASTYVDGFTGASSTAATFSSTNTSGTGEALTFAINVNNPLLATYEGLGDGVGITTANSGTNGDTPIASSAANAGSTYQGSIAQAHRGQKSLRFSFATNSAAYVNYNFITSATTNRFVVELYVYVPSTENVASTEAFQVRSAAGVVYAVGWTAGRLLRISVGTSSTQIWQSASPAPQDEWIRIRVAATPGTTTSNGAVEVAYFHGDDIIPIENSGLLSGQNLGTVSPTILRLGYSGLTTARTVYYDDVRAQELAGGYIGPTSPAYSAGAIQFVKQTERAVFQSTPSVIPHTSSTGNTLILTLLHQSFGSTSDSTVTDSAGNIWHRGADAAADGTGATAEQQVGIWYCINASPVTSVTITGDGSSRAILATLTEWTGITAVGTKSSAVRTASTAPSPSTVVPAAAQLVIGTMGYYDSTGPADTIFSNAGGYAPLASGSITTTFHRSAYTLQAAGMTAPTWVLTRPDVPGLATMAFVASPALPIAPAADQPTITTGPLAAGAVASALISGSVGYAREKRVGVAETAVGVAQSSTAALDLTGSSRYRYPGMHADFVTTTPSNPGQYVSTTYEPGSSATVQNTHYLFAVEFVTSSPQVAIRFNAVVTNPRTGRIYVNGLPISTNPATTMTATAGSGTEILLTFPSAAPRVIKIIGFNNDEGRFGGVDVAAGYTVTKPVTPLGDVLMFLGDSYMRGAGSNATTGANDIETWVWAVADGMGISNVFSDAIGGTGYVTDTGGLDNSFDTRSVDIAKSGATVLVIGGGRNDTTATGVQTVLEGLIDAATAAGVSTVYVTNSTADSQTSVQAAVAAAVASRSKKYVGGFSIDALPKIADGIHMTQTGHAMFAASTLTAMNASASTASVVYRSSSSSDAGKATPPTVPPGAAINDIMIALVSVDQSTGTISAPSGWIQLDQKPQSTPDGQMAAVFWKRLTAVDTVTYLFSYSGSSDFTVAINCFYNASTVNPPTISTVTQNAAGNASPVAVTANGVTCQTGDAVLFTAALDTTTQTAPTWTAASGFNSAAQSTASTWNPIYTAWKVNLTAGATGTVQATATSSGMTSGYIAWSINIPAIGTSIIRQFQIGSASPTALYVGSGQVDKVYQGSTLIWNK